MKNNTKIRLLLSIGAGLFLGFCGLTALEQEPVVNVENHIKEQVTDNGYCGSNASWTFSNGTGALNIEGTGDVTFDNGIVPWNDYRNSVTEINIEKGITSIPNNSFNNFSRLTEVSLYDSMNPIDKNTFLGSHDFNVTLKADTGVAKQSLFNGIEQLTSVYVENGVTQLNTYTFAYAPRLNTVSLPDNCRPNSYSFYFTGDNITLNVRFYTGLIDDNTFNSVYQPKTINIEEGITSIGNRSFYNSYWVRKVNLPASLTYIGDEAFVKCQQLTIINLENVKQIGNSAFSGLSVHNTHLDSVEKIGTHAFDGCYIYDLNLGTNLNEMGAFAFNNCGGLKSVNFNCLLKTIPENAFYGCKALQEVTFSNNLTSIEENAFNNCAKLKNVYFIGSCSSIHPTAFAQSINTTIHMGTHSYLENCFTSTYYTIVKEPSYVYSYHIRFISGEGNVVSTQTVNYGEMPVKPADPKDYSDLKYDYHFVGWNEEITAAVRDMDYTAAYMPTTKEYSITFKDYDGTILETQTYAYDDPINPPMDPTRPSTDMYDYSFMGWDHSVGTCTGHDVFTACYSENYRYYIVEFIDNGMIVESASYYYGQEIMPPTTGPFIKPSTPQYTYDFIGWDQELICTGPMEIHSVYKETIRSYKVTFQWSDGEYIHEALLPYGTLLEFPSNPTKQGDAAFSYVFDYWDHDENNTYVTGEMTITAYYQQILNEYTVTFLDYKDDIITQKTYTYGSSIEVPPDPQRPDDETYMYMFYAWDHPTDVTVEGNMTFRPFYYQTYIDYYVTFVDGDGAVIFSEPYHYGDAIADPTCTKEPDNKYTYTFSHWTPTFNSTCNGEATYTAVFDKQLIDYTINFFDNDGSLIKTQTLHYGDKIVPPVMEDKPNDSITKYVFRGWDTTPTTCSKDQNFTAVYESVLIDYTVKFINEDGTLLQEVIYHYGDQILDISHPTKDSDKYNDYYFLQWDGPLGTCIGDTTFRAMYDSSPRYYDVIFLADGKVFTEQSGTYGSAIQFPLDAPTKPSTDMYDYQFAGWDSYPDTITGDMTINAIFDEVLREYTITFVNWNGDLIETQTYHFGDLITAPADPERFSDDQKYYTFAGWNNVPGTVSENKTFTATYDEHWFEYTVTFYNEDGTVLEEVIYHFGDAINPIADPKKPSTEKYSYVFDGWGDLGYCYGDTSFTASYTQVDRFYVIEFVDEDGTVYQTQNLKLGDKVTAPANPTKDADKTYTYTFAGWDKSVTDVTGDATYTAKWNKTYIEYTITYLDDNGDVLYVFKGHYGDYLQEPENPTKPADNTYTYEFACWDKNNLVPVTEDATYTATYRKTYIEYTITFVNYNGDVLLESTYHYGDAVIVPPENPTKDADNIYTYEFAGWNKEITTATENTTYTATYNPIYIEYTITFANYDGLTIKTVTYHYGDQIQDIEHPSRDADNTYTYTFKSWDKVLGTCGGNETYTATYAPTYIEYTITFVDDLGNILSTQTLHYGDDIATPENPTKDADNTYTYAFARWDKDISTCLGNETFTSIFNKTYIEYKITFLNEDTSLIITQTYHYGESIVPPEDPTKASDNEYNYSFAGWNKDLVVVTKDTTYTATYSKTLREYIITFLNENGDVLDTVTYHWGEQIQDITHPTKNADETYTYAYKSWDKVLGTCAGEDTFTATYTSTYIEYTVRFVDEDGTLLQEFTYHYGDRINDIEHPTKEQDDVFTYNFGGWSDELVCYGDLTLTATYTSYYREYVVTFFNYDGSFLSRAYYHYGDTIKSPSIPTKPADKTYTYEFAGWNKELVCNGHMDIGATYTPIYIEYTVTFYDYDGSIIETANYHYGDQIVAIPEPERASSLTYTYAFSGWGRELGICTGNDSFTAKYEATYIEYTITFVWEDGLAITTKTVHYGDHVAFPSNPTRESSERYDYAFDHWTTQDNLQFIDNYIYCEGSETIVAHYSLSARTYTVTFVDDDGTVLYTDTYYYGNNIRVYDGVEKASDNYYNYVFVKWNCDNNPNVVYGDTVFTAEYRSEVRYYTIKFVDYDGTLIKEYTSTYDEALQYPENPTREPDNEWTYTFSNWSGDTQTVKGDKTYTATYTKNTRYFTINYYDGNGDLFYTDYQTYGEILEEPWKVPTKKADKTYTYTFSYWDMGNYVCYGDTDIYAVFDAKYIEYTVKFLNYDGTTLSISTLHYGDSVRLPRNPSKPSDNTYYYEFSYWDGYSRECKGNATYTPVFTKTYIEYVVRFYNYTGNVLQSKYYHYGDIIDVPNGPSKPSDDHYDYKFSNWSPNPYKCNGNLSFHPIYTQKYNASHYSIEEMNNIVNDLNYIRGHVTINDYSLICSCYNRIQTLLPRDQEAIKSLFDNVVNEYNKLVNSINEEFEASKNETMPLLYCTVGATNLLALCYFVLRRKF